MVLPAHHADANALDHAGRTPLCYAAQNGDTTTISFLLRAGADPKFDKSDRPVTNYAAINGKTGALKTLLGNGADIVGETGNWLITTLHVVIGRGHRDTALFILEQDKQNDLLERKNVWDKTVPHNACEKGDTILVQELLKKGADLRPLDNSSRSALHWASFSGVPPLI